jgi:multicomponent Na+:H+ antiporter subunit B
MKNPDSFVLQKAAALLFFLVNFFAIYLFLRGHNLPGGGFIAGLASGISVILLGLAQGFQVIEKWFRIDPMRMAAWGLMLALVTGFLPLLPFFPGQSFLEHTMFHPNLPFVGKIHIGTTFFFDLGVFLVVVGVTVKLIVVLALSTFGEPALPKDQIAYYASPVEGRIEEGHQGEREFVEEDTAYAAQFEEGLAVNVRSRNEKEDQNHGH